MGFALAGAGGNDAAAGVRFKVQPSGKTTVKHTARTRKRRVFMNQWLEYSCSRRQLQEREWIEIHLSPTTTRLTSRKFTGPIKPEGRSGSSLA